MSLDLESGRNSKPTRRRNYRQPHIDERRPVNRTASPARPLEKPPYPRSLEVSSGNYNQQREYLLNKSLKWTASMRAATLMKDEANMSYSRIYIPSLRYGLGTRYLSPKELLQIQHPAVNVILPKMGFNRHLPLSTAIYLAP